MWAHCVVVMRIGDDLFWELTPRETFALMQAFRDHERLKNYRAGLTPSILSDIHRDPKRTKKHMAPLDFFEGKEGARNRFPTFEELKHKLSVFAGTMIAKQKQ